MSKVDSAEKMFAIVGFSALGLTLYSWVFMMIVALAFDAGPMRTSVLVLLFFTGLFSGALAIITARVCMNPRHEQK